MTINYKNLLEKYRFQFEGIPDPVFYYNLYPTSKLEKSNQWERYNFGRDLKEPFKYHKHKQHLDVLDGFLSILLEGNSKIIGITTIPSSDSTYTNSVTEIVQYWIQNNNQNTKNIKDLTHNLKRLESKKEAHTSGDRNQKDNISTLEFQNNEVVKKIDVLIVIDDIVTSGNSFTAVKKIVNDSGFNKEVINFAFSRSMNESAHANYDEWNSNCRNSLGEKKGKIDGVIFDFDQTLVDTSLRNDEFESNLRNVRNNLHRSEKNNFITFLKENSLVYSIYEEEQVLAFQQKRIPFAILSNSWERRIALLSQVSSVQKFLYPDIWASYGNKDATVIKYYEKYIDKASLNKDGFPYRYPFNKALNIFTAPQEEKQDGKYKITYAKPNEKGVLEAKSWLEKEFNLSNLSRVIGLGNTMEDIIAYNKAGVESCLALWGIPVICQEYAIKNWGADYVFKSFKDFSEWVEKQEKDVSNGSPFNLEVNFNDVIEEFDDEKYTVFEELNGDFWSLRRTKRNIQVNEYSNIRILDEFMGQKKADLYIVQQFSKNDDINRYGNDSINIYTIIEYFPGEIHWEWLNLLSEKLNKRIAVSRRLEEAYKANQLNNFDLGDIRTKKQNLNALKILKSWKIKNLEWPGI